MRSVKLSYGMRLTISRLNSCGFCKTLFDAYSNPVRDFIASVHNFILRAHNFILREQHKKGETKSTAKVLLFLPKSPATEQLYLPGNNFIYLLQQLYSSNKVLHFLGEPVLRCMG